jgi:hypothetical protein
MPNKLDPSALLNPMTWTDAGLRALEMAVSSTQNISEEVDRLARAGADAELVDVAASGTAAAVQPASRGSSWAAMAADLQRSSFEVMTQNWLQSVSAINNFLSLGARLPSTQGLSWQLLPWEAMRRILLPINWGNPAMLMNPASSQHDDDVGGRQAQRGNGRAEHAHASAERGRHRSTSRTSRSGGTSRSGNRRTRSNSRHSRST